MLIGLINYSQDAVGYRVVFTQ